VKSVGLCLAHFIKEDSSVPTMIVRPVSTAWTRLLSFVLSLAVVLFAVAPALATSIQTDLWVYQYGDTVNVTGDGFGVTEPVDVVTTDPNGVEVDRGTAQSDDAGYIAYSFVLASDVAGIYDVVATGLISGLTASTQFDPKPSLTITFPVDGAVYNAAGWALGCAPMAGACGTAAPDSGQTLVSVQYSMRQGTGNYWHPSPNGFTDTAEVLRDVGSGTLASWRLAFPASRFTPDGAYTLHIVVTQTGSNNTMREQSVTFTIDTVAPGQPIPTSSTPSSPANNNSPTINGTAEGNSIVKLYNSSSCAGALFGTGTASNGGSFSIPVAPIADNTSYDFYATATDAAGNVSACSAAHVPYVEDSVAAAPILISSTPSSPGNSTSPTINGTAEAGSLVKLYKASGCSGTVQGSGIATAGAFAISVSVATNSTTTFFGKVDTDLAGNTSACSSTSVTYTQAAIAGTSLVASSANGTYGGTVNLSATLTSGGLGVSGKTISFSLNGGSVGSATTNASGVATLSGASLSGINVGAYGTGVSASFAGDSGYGASVATNSLTVTAKSVTVTPDSGQHKVFGSADPLAFAYTLSEAIGVSGALSRVSGENVGNYAIGLGTLVATSSNYTLVLSATPVNFTITAKPVTVTPNAGQHKVFGSGDPALTFSNDGGLADAAFTGALHRAVGENVGSYLIDLGNLSAGSNYSLSLSATPVNFTITAKPVTVTPDSGQHKTYGNNDPDAFTFTLSEDISVIGALDRDGGEDVGNYAITLGNLAAVSSNYSLVLSATPVSFVIDQRPVTVSVTAGQHKVYGNLDPAAFTYAITSGTLVSGDAFSGALSRAPGENVGSYAIGQNSLTLGTNYDLHFVGADFVIDQRPVTVAADPKSKVLGGTDPPLTYQITSGTVVSGDAFSGALSRAPGEAIGTYPIVQNTLALSSNYALTYNGANLSINYASGGSCLGSAGHQILQPINFDGTSVFKQGSTVPAKFRVCDANGNSIGTPGVVSSFKLVGTISGTASAVVDEEVISTTPDPAFRWSSTDQQWIFNMNTKKQSANITYFYLITLNDHSTIAFQFGLK
jgi:hypothetical protein